MNRTRPLLSIVVPVYKVEPFLEKCVRSILAQTLTDFELILVDDGSPDRCPQICDALAATDSRIQVIHQQNKGLSGARNAGIEVAAGSYIAFVDSDDYIAPDMYEKLYGALVNSGAQVAVCNFRNVDENGNPLETGHDRLDPGLYTGREFLHKVADRNATPYLVAWNKLYRRELFDTLRYEPGKQNEDTRIFFPLFFPVEKLVCIDDALYFYVSNSGSIMRRKATLRNLDNAEAFGVCFDFCRSHGLTDLLAPLEKRFFAKLSGVFYQLSAQERGEPRMDEVLRQHRDMLRHLRKNGLLSTAVGLRAGVFHLCPGLYRLWMRRG